MADDDRALDQDLGEQDSPDPGDPAGVAEVDTGWEPTTDDEMEDDHA
jgi:hypothetical protein